MNRSCLVAFVFFAVVAPAAWSELPSLPISRAPFEQSAEIARRPVTLAAWPFHPTAGWNLLGEERLTTWAEFRSGDKFAVANGYDGRIHFVGRTGFGKVLFYRGGSEKATPTDSEKPDPYGRELLAWMEIRVLDESKPYARYMESYSNATIRVDDKTASIAWSRPCKGGAARYSIAPDGDGRLALEWNVPQPVEFRLYLCGNSTNGVNGIENGTRLYVNRNSETERIEIGFPDGVIECCGQGAARPTGSTNPAPDYVWRTDAASGRVLVDLCGSTIPKRGAHTSSDRMRGSLRSGDTGGRALPSNSSTPNSSTPNSGIIDFWECDAVDVPRDPTGNFLSNGSFELGLVDWNYWWGGEPWYMVAETGGPLETITDEAKTVERALRMRRSRTRDKYEALQSAPMSLEPGAEHVLSAWVKRAKGEQGKAKITLAASPVAKKFHVVTKPDGGEAKLVAALADDEWHFVEMPFVSECGDCKIILDGSGAAAVIDDVRVERKPVDTFGRVERAEHVEGRLETASAENIVYSGTPINARLVLSGADGVEGVARVTARNFYNEVVYDKALPFALPKDKVLPLDFDTEELGTGVFVLGVEFKIKNNLDNYRSPYQRFAILKPLDGRQPTADFYLQLGWYEKSSNGEKIARYSRDLGITATNWRTNNRFADTNAPETQLRKKYGLANRLHTVSSELAGMYPDSCRPGMPYNPKALTNAVPEKVAFIEKAAYEVGMKAAPDDNWWSFYNEEDAEIPAIRYAKTREERRKACEDWFQYQYACWKGLKKAFDERGMKLMYAPTHGCCNYNQEWRREMMDLFMEIAASHGFRYDFIAIHTYYAVDNSYLGCFDRDANAAALLSRMEKLGYGDAPVMFSEGFNILPFFAPRFGAVSGADAYLNGGPTSLDLGWREFLQAGAMARLYIMDLKYWPRVKNSHSWQHRLVADAQMSPYMWNMVPNTLGHLLPSPKFVGDVKRDGWRAYVFRQDDHGVAAVWTNERQVELGRKKGMSLSVNLPEDACFIDLMGNCRAAPSCGKDGSMAIPLTPAPLFVTSCDAEGLLKGVVNALVAEGTAGSAAPATPWVAEEERALVMPMKVQRIERTPVGQNPIRFWTNETGFVEINYDESKAGVLGKDYEIPDPLVFSDGRKVASAADWAERRKEILGVFEREVYGRMPPKPDAMVFELVSEKITEDRFATERRYRQWFRADKSGPCVDWIVFVPRHAKKPCPVILHLNYKGNDLIASGRTNHFVLPLGEFAARGYAFMSANYKQMSSDGPGRPGEPLDGLFALWGARDPKRTDNTGAIMAWAWGLCRGLDLAEGVEEIDAARSVVVGSSRLGKAALLAAAFDERFAGCVANQTGAVGVQLMKRDFGESIAAQRLMFPWWYCQGLWKWAGREREMPFDQHMLLACVAPRALLLECYDKKWFDPRGEWLAAQAAAPVWRALGADVAFDGVQPEPYDDVAAVPPFGYVRRTEEHGLSPYDWKWALDFADQIFKQKTKGETK